MKQQCLQASESALLTVVVKHSQHVRKHAGKGVPDVCEVSKAVLQNRVQHEANQGNVSHTRTAQQIKLPMHKYKGAVSLVAGRHELSSHTGFVLHTAAA